MELEVYWLKSAENKLDDIYSYYLKVAGKRIAEKLVLDILKSTITLKNMPKMGQIELLLQDRKEKFRYLVCKNYKIIYWVNEKK